MNNDDGQARKLQNLVKKLYEQEELLTDARENSNYLIKFNKHIYMDLVKQRDNAKSEILYDLLNKEILSMQQLSDQFIERWKVFIELKNESLDNAIKANDLCQENAKKIQ